MFYTGRSRGRWKSMCTFLCVGMIVCVCVCVCVCACVCVCGCVGMDRLLSVNCFERHACLVAQSCLTLCDPMDCSPPDCSVHRILQARILVWVAIPFFRGSSIPFFRGSSQPRVWIWVFCIAGRLFTFWATREAYLNFLYIFKKKNT